MDSFEFMSPTKFILDKDADLLCGREIKNYSDNVLFVHYGDKYTYESGLYDRIMGAIKEAEIECYELPGVQPNPRVSLVREGIKICREHNIGCILAVGGGSVIDTAKAVGIGVFYDGDVWDYYSKSCSHQISARGTVRPSCNRKRGKQWKCTENDETGESADVMGDILRPKFTLMNPQLTMTLPKKQTVYGIIDIFSHVLERYFSTSVDAHLTDYMWRAYEIHHCQRKYTNERS